MGDEIVLTKSTGHTKYVPQTAEAREFLKRNGLPLLGIAPNSLEGIIQACNEEDVKLVLHDERQECIKSFREILKEADQPEPRGKPRLYSVFRRPSSSWTEGQSGVFYVSLHVVLYLQPFDVTDVAGRIFDAEPYHIYFPATWRSSAEIRLTGSREIAQEAFIRQIAFQLYDNSDTIHPILL